MTTTEAQKLLDKIVKQVFDCKNPFALDQFMQKFAFDIRLPQPVTDSIDGNTTWTQSTNPVKFASLDNIINNGEEYGGIKPKQDLESIEDIFSAWNEVNLMTTERYVNSINTAKSDNIYDSENIYRSQDIRKSKNIIFCDGMSNCEFVATSQRVDGMTYCIRVEDSIFCNNCFNITFSRKLTNCFFVSGSADLQDCMFCNNLNSQKFCIANMQYNEEEYNKIKKMVIEWVLSN